MDEPSNGMDVKTRQNLWEILGKIKKNKIIILTTHNMKEAEILGDKINILVKGEVKVSGSSYDIK